MKTTMFVIGAMATVAAAQDASLSGFDTLPDCGQTCITNMINLAEDLGCTDSDVACLCLNPDFSYGVRDCTDQSCPSNQDALDTQSWAVGICANQGVAVTSASSDSITVSTRSGATPSTADESTETGVISVTSSVTATISSSGSVITTVVPTVVPSTSGSSTGVVRTSTTASTTTTQRPSQTDNSDDNNGDDNGDGSNGDGDNAARATAVPIGIMAFAGVAALLL